MKKQLTTLTRTDLEEWWERVPGARRFMKTLGDEAEKNRAAAIDISDEDAEDFISIFTEEVQRRNYLLVIERLTLDGASAMNEFVTTLAEHFEPSYLPDLLSGSLMADVARKKILSGYVLVVKVPGRASWLTELISDFNRVEDVDKGALIFLTSELPAQFTFRLTDFVTPYDVQFFAINLLETARLSQTEKLYTATLTAKLAKTSAVLTKNLSTPELYFDGARLMEEVFGEEFNRRTFERAVWETQIQFALPIVETVREKLIARNLIDLKKLLPVTDEFGKTLSSPWDMELRHLHYYGGNVKVFSQTDWDVLELVYRARNDLSHLESIETDRLEKIFSLTEFCSSFD